MIGVLLALAGTFLGEVSNSIGKRKVEEKAIGIYSMGFIQIIGAFLFFVLIVILNRSAFVFQLTSFKTYLPRLALEILQLHATLLAVIRTDRSTYGFFRTATVPLLLLVDVILGYQLNFAQIFGIGLIAVTFILMFVGRAVFSKTGIGWVVLITLNAVVTTSLYKYDITHFNSVAAEQLPMLLLSLIYLLFMSYITAGENPFKFFRKRIYQTQSLADGVAGVVLSYAIAFAPASVIIAAKRSGEVLWATLSGNIYFAERNLALKLTIFLLLATGIVLLVV